MSTTTRASWQQGLALSVIWLCLWLIVRDPWIAATATLGLGLALVVRSRNILHRYTEDFDGRLLPLISGLESDIAYRVQKYQQSFGDTLDVQKDRLLQLEQALNALDRGFVILDPNNALVWWNDSAEDILHLDPQLDRNRPLGQLLRDPALEPLFSTYEGSVHVAAPDPQNPDHMLDFRAIGQADGSKVMVIRDITRILRLEQTRSDFASNVSHELKTPLTVIKGYAESLQDYGHELPAPMAKGLGHIEKQARRMQDIVEDLLWLNRLENTKLVDPQPIKMEQLFAQVKTEALELAETLQRTPTIEYHCLNQVDWVGDHREILTLVRNLTVNAVRYGQDDVRIELSWSESDDGALLSVKDNGPGIAARDLPRVTERFYRADKGRSRDSGGTGLGLAIVKYVVERHNGELDIQSRIGHGTVFTVDVPAQSLSRR